MRSAAIIIVLWLVAACVPLNRPPQLNQTPGPAVQVTDRVFQSDAFSLRYPAGWRVVTSAAGDAPYAVFAAPEDAAVIIVALDSPPPSPLTGETYSVERRIDLGGGRQITAVLHASAADWMAYRAVFDALVESVH